jgi:hypothetical protein
LVHEGAVITEGKGSGITVNLYGHKGYFHRPHTGDMADKGAIENALSLLRIAGIIR